MLCILLGCARFLRPVVVLPSSFVGERKRVRVTKHVVDFVLYHSVLKRKDKLCINTILSKGSYISGQGGSVLPRPRLGLPLSSRCRVPSAPRLCCRV